MNIKISPNAPKKKHKNARKKIRRRRDWSVDDIDAVEISTAPRSVTYVVHPAVFFELVVGFFYFFVDLLICCTAYGLLYIALCNKFTRNRKEWSSGLLETI